MTMKGGQAKTTLAINLAARIAKARREVLLIDSDIQANVTTTFQRDHHCNLANVILGKVNNFEFIELERHLCFLPSGGEAMLEASSYLSQTRFKDALFKNLLSSVHQKIVIIDTAPSWSVVSRNILMYVDYVIVPVVTDYLGFSGCDQIMAYIDEFKQSMLGQCNAKVTNPEESRQTFFQRTACLLRCRRRRLSGERQVLGHPTIWKHFGCLSQTVVSDGEYSGLAPWW